MGHERYDPTHGMGTGSFSYNLQKLGAFLARHPIQVILIWATAVGVITFFALTLTPFRLINAPFTPRDNAFKLRNDALTAAQRLSGVEPGEVVPQGSLNFGALSLVYGPTPDSPDPNNILSPLNTDVLSQIHDFEQDILTDDEFPNLCDRSAGPFCLVASVANSLYPPGGLGTNQIPTQELGNASVLATGISGLISEDWDQAAGTASYIRSIIYFGAPIDGYDSPVEDIAEQAEERDDFILEFYDTILEATKVEGNDWQLFFAGTALSEKEFNGYIASDGAWTGLAGAYVLVYGWVHTGSFLLSFLGLLNLVSAFGPSYFLMVIVLGGSIGTVNLISVFLLLGIGADNVFITVDTWRHSFNHFTSFEKRLAWSYTRGFKSMSVTTATTAMSFLANTISSVPTIRSFGIFAAILVVMNFLMVSTYYFAVVALWDRKHRAELLKLHALTKPDVSTILDADYNEEQVFADAETAGVETTKPAISGDIVGADVHTAPTIPGEAADPTLEEVTIHVPSPNEPAPDPEALTHGEEELVADIIKEEGAGRVELFLVKTYTPFMFRNRFLILGFVCIWLAFITPFAAQLGPLEESARDLPLDSNFEQFKDVSGEFLSAGADTVSVNIVHGITGIDRSDVEDLDSTEDLGVPVYDEKFDLVSNQAALVAMCDDIDTFGTEWVADDIHCPLRDIRDWCAGSCGSFPFANTTTLLNATIGWLAENPSKSSLFGLNGDSDAVLFHVIEVPTPMSADDTGPAIEPHFEFWQTWIEEQNDDNGESLDGFAGSTAWVSMILDQTLYFTAFLGMAAGLFVAFWVLMFASGSALVALYSSSSIGFALVSVMGLLVILGYGMGVGESLLLTTTVGISVDYVVHLGEAYMASVQKSRRARMLEAVGHIGQSILGSATSTLLSSSALFFTSIALSKVMGIMIGLTIGFSAIFTFVYFIPLMMTVGPQEGFCEPRKHSRPGALAREAARKAAGKDPKPVDRPAVGDFANNAKSKKKRNSTTGITPAQTGARRVSYTRGNRRSSTKGPNEKEKKALEAIASSLGTEDKSDIIAAVVAGASPNASPGRRASLEPGSPAHLEIIARVPDPGALSAAADDDDAGEAPPVPQPPPSQED